MSADTGGTMDFNYIIHTYLSGYQDWFSGVVSPQDIQKQGNSEYTYKIASGKTEAAYFGKKSI
jgi:hypothetical protein